MTEPIPLMRKEEIGSGAFELHPIGFVHERLERFHARAHAGVVEGADVEKIILKGLGAHLACCAIAGVGQRSTTHFVLLMRQSITGRSLPATKRIFSSGTSESSVILWLPRTAM